MNAGDDDDNKLTLSQHTYRFGEILMRIQRKARTHEYIENVVDMTFRESIPYALTGEIGMTTHVTLLTGHELVGVRIAARSDHVVDTGAVLIKAVGDGIIGDGGQRPQKWHITPESVAGWKRNEC